MPKIMLPVLFTCLLNAFLSQGQHYGNYHDYGSYFYHGYNGSYAQNVYGNWSNHYGNSSDYYNNYSDGVTPHPFHFEPCGGQLSEFAGLIKTPGYPTESYPSSTYPPYKDCWWYRDGDEKTLVQVKFWDLEIEIGAADSNVTCDFDFVNVSITSIGWRLFCGYHTPEEEISGVGTLDIYFHSDDTEQHRGFQASYMKNYDPCVPNPCIYGLCVTTDDGTLPLCDCGEGYTGEQCEVDIAECRSTPCQNEGTCIEPVPAKYVCQCSEGFEGENCEKVAVGGSKLGDQRPSPCSSEPCQNNVVCQEISETEYKCNSEPCIAVVMRCIFLSLLFSFCAVLTT